MKISFKNFIAAFLLAAIVSAGVETFANQKNSTITIKTSAICNSCKARLEKAVKAVDGVEEAMLNLNNKKIKILYDPAKINPDNLRKVIANTGYDADDVKKNEDAFKNLPECCQSPDKHSH